jgi:hypothetical protein
MILRWFLSFTFPLFLFGCDSADFSSSNTQRKNPSSMMTGDNNGENLIVKEAAGEELDVKDASPGSEDLGDDKKNPNGEDLEEELSGPAKEGVDFDETEKGSVVGGLDGGKIGVGTAYKVYKKAHGSFDARVVDSQSKYDVDYNVAGIDAFNFFPESLTEIQNRISDPKKRFVLIVANASLSPKAALKINDQEVWAVDYQAALKALAAGALPQVFTMGEPTENGDKKLSTLKVAFSRKSSLNGGLRPARLNDVQSNVLGPNGEYRNGALVIQAIDAALFNTLDPKTGVASMNQGQALLWEVVVFSSL